MFLTFSFTNQFYVFPSVDIFDHFITWTYIIQNKNKSKALRLFCLSFFWFCKTEPHWLVKLTIRARLASNLQQSPDPASQCWHDTCVPLHSATESVFKLRYDTVHEILLTHFFFFQILEGINAVKYERPKYRITHYPKI